MELHGTEIKASHVPTTWSANENNFSLSIIVSDYSGRRLRYIFPAQVMLNGEAEMVDNCTKIRYIYLTKIQRAAAVPLVSHPLANITVNLDPSFAAFSNSSYATRSLWNIIWDCLLTTFACSWLSVHPNVPRNGATKWTKRSMCVKYMTWAIIAPELIILWAMKQRYGAQQVAGQFEGWTIQHGYLLQMGGFILYDGKEPLGVLSIDMLRKYVHRINLDHPTLSVEAIEDKSKSDGLAKALVTIQVIWFVIQVFARYIQGLLVTQLEIATIALGVLNGAMFIGWRKKPLNVDVPIPIYLGPADEEYRPDENNQPLDGQMNDCAVDHKWEAVSQDCNFGETPQNDDIKTRSWPYKMLFVWPKGFVMATMMDVQEMSLHAVSGSYVSFNRVSTFYALPVSLKDGTKMSIVLSIMGLIFGAIHCIPWSFNFPSFTECLIWRISSIVVVAWLAASLIMLMAQLCFVDPTWDDAKREQMYELENCSLTKIAMCIKAMFCLIVTCGIPAYVFARLALLVEAFTTLRDLPPEAYRVVEWSSLIPHII